MAHHRQGTPKTSEDQENTTQDRPLQSWKEIAAYLDRDERTAQRWEKAEGLPVRRYRSGPRSSVYAYPSELEAWRTAREPKEAEEANSKATLPRWVVPAMGTLLVLVPVTWFFTYGPIFNPPNPLVEAAGITLRQVWAGPEVDDMGDVSSNGQFLTYTDWKTGDLAIRDLDKEVNRRLTNKGSWLESDQFAEFSIVSPDGGQISYSWCNEEGDYELRLMDLERSETDVLHRCTGEEWIRPVDWFPDGAKILVGLWEKRELKRLAVISISDHSSRCIASSLWKGLDVTVRLSPNGNYIVYDDLSKEKADQRDLFLIPSEGGTPVQLVHHPADDSMPVWSPDGQSIVFASDRTGTLGLWMIRQKEGIPIGEPQFVKDDLTALQSIIGCTRKGDLYFSLGAGMEDIYLFEMDPESGELLAQPSKLAGRYVGANMGPVFSPDGKYLAYHFQRAPDIKTPGGVNLVVRSLRTGAEREIRTPVVEWGHVRWFPDGESVLVPVLRSREDRVIDYYRIYLETGETELIRKSESNMFTTWQPDLSRDGRSLFFTEANLEDPQRRWVRFKKLEIESGRETFLHQLPSDTQAWSIQLSPDEKTIAWTQFSKQGPAWSLNARPVIGGSTREILRLTQPESFPATFGLVWTQDGQHLLVSKFTGKGPDSEIMQLPVEGGEPSKLGISMDRILLGDIHKDGRLVAFYAGEQKGRAREIWALEDFLSE